MKDLLLFCLFAGWAGMLFAADALPVLDPYGTVRKVGNFEVKQLHTHGLLPHVVLEGKRSISLRFGAEFDPLFDTINFQTPAVESALGRVEDEMYAYFIESWKDWRAAANQYLPAKYQLPELSFKKLSKDAAAPADAVPVFLTARFPAVRSKEAGFYVIHTDQIGLIFPIHFLKYLAFTDKDPVRRAFMEGDLRNALCNIAAGPDNYWENLVVKGNTLDGIEWLNRRTDVPDKQEEACLAELSSIPADEWIRRGTFASNNKHTITHEWGHFLGFGHMDDSVMATGVLRNFSQTKPADGDGLRLAVLTCWYHNKRAGKEVCLPQVKTALPAPASK